MKVRTLLLFVLLISIIACGPEGTSIDYEGEIIDQEQSELLEPTTKNLYFNLGEDIQLGDFVVKVNKVADHKNYNEYLGPGEGNKFVAVEVEYFNPTPDKHINTSPMDWVLYDQEDYGYNNDMVIDPKKPALDDFVVNPNGKVKGWITFEIPKSSNPKRMQFHPSFIDNSNIEIALQ